MQAGFPRGVGQAAWFVQRRRMEPARMLTGGCSVPARGARWPCRVPPDPMYSSRVAVELMLVYGRGFEGRADDLVVPNGNAARAFAA